MDQIKHLNTLDYLVVLLYMLMLSGVGIYFKLLDKEEIKWSP